MIEDVLFLLTTKKEQDELGRFFSKKEKRQVLCKVRSVSFSEFFNAGRNGLNPALEFLVFSGDYNGEQEAEYRGQVYSVYRTYKNGDYTELYVQREGGKYGQAKS